MLGRSQTENAGKKWNELDTENGIEISKDSSSPSHGNRWDGSPRAARFTVKKLIHVADKLLFAIATQLLLSRPRSHKMPLQAHGFPRTQGECSKQMFAGSCLLRK
ncbi:hypothetical protein STEG23_025460, partial [Scotinomys teguina]